jgi:hypothetical protein
MNFEQAHQQSTVFAAAMYVVQMPKTKTLTI